MKNTRSKRNTQMVIVMAVTLVIVLLAALYFPNDTRVGSERYDHSTTVSKQSTEQGIYQSTEEALAVLETIPIEEDAQVDYDREEQFGTWKRSGYATTRDAVLNYQSETCKTNNTNNTVKPYAGEWDIFYLGETVVCNNSDEVSNLEIDHIVPLSYAYHHGAADWDDDKRHEFANDYGVDEVYTSGINTTYDYDNATMGNLIVSDRKSNRAKSDKAPSEWMPQANQRLYCEMWIDICDTYGISLTQADHDAIVAVLSN